MKTTLIFRILSLILSSVSILSGCTEEEYSSFSQEGETSDGCRNVLAYYDTKEYEFRTITVPVYKEVCE